MVTIFQNLIQQQEIAFSFDLCGSKRKYEEEKILSLKAHKSGLCYGVIQWLGLKIFKDIKYENRPGEIPSHWSTPIYSFNEPIYIVDGQEITIKATLLEDKVWFSQHIQSLHFIDLQINNRCYISTDIQTDPNQLGKD